MKSAKPEAAEFLAASFVLLCCLMQLLPPFISDKTEAKEVQINLKGLKGKELVKETALDCEASQAIQAKALLRSLD